jgi:hypothetical protein
LSVNRLELQLHRTFIPLFTGSNLISIGPAVTETTFTTPGLHYGARRGAKTQVDLSEYADPRGS